MISKICLLVASLLSFLGGVYSNELKDIPLPVVADNPFYRALGLPKKQVLIKNNLKISSNKGFIFLEGDAMINNTIWEALGDHFIQKNYWNTLGDDPVYNFRKTNHSKLELNSKDNTLKLLPEEGFIIPNDENPKLGNKVRFFPTAKLSFLQDPFLLSYVWEIYDSLPIGIDNNSTNENYVVGIHPFRIIDDGTGIGLPTPEGIHKDGCEYVTITLINRDNVHKDSGKSKVYNNNAEKGVPSDMTQEQHNYNENDCLILEHIMVNPFDTIILNDRITHHSVQGISPQIIGKHAIRDVLVTTWMSKSFKQNTYSKYG